MNAPTQGILLPFQGVFPRDTIEIESINCFPFDSFFEGQLESIVDIVDSFLNKGVKHVILEAPTGVGKTIIAYTVHRTIDRLLGATRLRTSVTTTTKGLQRQYENDTKTYDLKGKKNYMCPLGQEHYGTAGCKNLCAKRQCRPKSDCPFVTRRLNWTENSYWRCTNTAMFISMPPELCMKDTNKADLVVLDECHKLPNTLLDQMTISFDPESLQAVNLLYGRPSKVYIEATKVTEKLIELFSSKVGQLVDIPEKLVTSEEEGEVSVWKVYEHLSKLLEFVEVKLKDDKIDEKIKDICGRVLEHCSTWRTTCGVLLECGAREFVVQSCSNGNIEFKPVYPAHVSEYGGFRKGDYFLHMSATICGLGAYASLLGIKEGEYVTIEMPHPIPVESRPINYIPIAKMSGRNVDENVLTSMVKAIDELITERPNDNGLVHTSSYALAEKLMTRSKFKQKMFIGRDRQQTMELLKMNANIKDRSVVVLSPSMVEGFDLKYDLCRWQVIAKVPFGFLGDPLIRYLCDKNPGAYNRQTVLEVVQASGRVVRGVDDFGETFILDSSFSQLMGRGHKYFPKWYLDALREF